MTAFVSASDLLSEEISRFFNLVAFVFGRVVEGTKIDLYFSTDACTAVIILVSSESFSNYLPNFFFAVLPGLPGIPSTQGAQL